MNDAYHTKNGRTSKRGAFINGIWHCDCEPRLPAEKFQTKNGGKNHGRWFYTCQKPQPKRCSFFLWSDDAKVREESAVMSNSRSEPTIIPEPKTPMKQSKLTQPITPVSKARSVTISPGSPSKQLWPAVNINDPDEETFGWSSSGDEELATVAEAATKDEQESPRKAARTLFFDSPGKRSHAETALSSKSGDTWPFGDDILLTPTTSTMSNGLLSPIDSQLRLPPRTAEPQLSSNIVSEALEILKPANLTTQVENELVELLNRYDLRTQGIAKGRDITRVAIQSKDKRIAELQARITALEAEKETSRTVIAHLKQDIATSPKRPNRSRFGRKAEV